MKYSNNIPQRIKEYLNDVEDYGDETIYTTSYTKICEDVLSNIKPLILESLNPISILENYKKNLNKVEKTVIDDFILYMESI
tara:strand:- start:104 stop:349 length:246 start_codon:yes stop_codon:yes gene_type:complete